ncbi:hypothetical protein P8452_03873 [Trifolium repens]|jgi:hypothetical protein|nr:hypothetical protein QL285_004231 [Trifolium repens]KAK2456909.1 hypothetical protein QL285_004233 [Trifolium repens]WJX13489.1 hypothetical protein P8452_03873 [Trifolium repens]
MEDNQVHVIVVEEVSKSSNEINPRYPNSDKEIFKKVLVSSLVLCLLLSIVSALKIDNSKLLMDTLTLPVVLFQLDLFHIIIDHPVNSTVYSILYILLLSSVISVVEVSFVSWNAAIVILIVWVAIIANITISNKEEIYNVDNIAVSNIILRLTSIAFVLSLFYSFVFSYISLWSLVVPY